MFSDRNVAYAAENIQLHQLDSVEQRALSHFSDGYVILLRRQRSHVRIVSGAPAFLYFSTRCARTNSKSNSASFDRVSKRSKFVAECSYLATEGIDRTFRCKPGCRSFVSDRPGCAGTARPERTHASPGPLVGCACVLGLVIAYAIFRNRTRSRAEKQVTERATKKLYDEEERDRKRSGSV